MGWYLSEGNYDRSHERVTITQTKLSTDLLDVLTKTGLRWNEYRQKDRLQGYRCTNREMNQYLKQFGHAHDKRVPDEIRSMPAPFIEAFVMAYTYGDGHLRPPRRGPKSSTEHTVFSVRERLIDGMQELALKLGWASTKRFQKAQTSTMRDGRKIHSAGIWVCHFKKEWDRAELLPSQFKRLNYKGKIYCLNVPYHTLYVRRQGKVCWNGNTPAAVFGQRTARGVVNILDALYEENIGLEKFLEEYVKPLISQRFPRNRIIVVGDPAGWDKSQLSEESVADVFKRQYMVAVRAPTNDPEKRIAAVEKLLAKQIDGKAMLLIDPRCKHLIQGLYGGYKFKRKKTGEYETAPSKDEFSHDNDALQYLALGLDAVGGAALLKNNGRREVVLVSAAGWT
jgi:hypothetical protein